MERYRWQHASDQLDPLVRELWMRIADGRGQDQRAQRLRHRIAELSRQGGLDPDKEIHYRLGSALNYAAWQGWYRERKPKNKKEQRYARLQVEMSKFMKSLNVKVVQYGSSSYPDVGGELYKLRTQLLSEYRKPHPDYRKVRQLESRFTALYGATYRDPRSNFVATRLESERLERESATASKQGDTKKLAELQGRRRDVVNTLYSSLITNLGDPLISVGAPADALRVIAIMPDGAIKQLDFNAGRKKWEGCFDIATYAREGDYRITLIIVYKDQSRRELAMHYRVDTTPPTGSGEAHAMAAAPTNSVSGPSLHLELEHSGDTARVAALLPWGEKVQLTSSTVEPGRFFGLVPVPPGYVGKTVVVTYVLTDKAHNRTTITVDMTK
jgi:hypothetical protein